MAERKHRTQILLEPKEHAKLVRIASQEGRSVSDVIGGLIRHELERRGERDQRLAGIDAIRSMREEILARRGGRPLDVDIESVIDQMRDERDGELLDRIRSVHR